MVIIVTSNVIDIRVFRLFYNSFLNCFELGGVRQNQGGQSAQANAIRNSARPITGQQQAAGIQVSIFFITIKRKL